MGGIGSGRLPSSDKKVTVEKCLSLSASDFLTLIDKGVYGDFTWTNTIFGTEVASISFTMLPDEREPILILNYSVNEKKIEQIVYFNKTVPNFGGIRWWLTCPLCKCRVAIIYLPDEAELFACRNCHNLAYRKKDKLSLLPDGPSFLCKS